VFNGVLGYQYFVAAAEMPQDCAYMRTRLQIEYLRLLDWVDVAGLIEYKEGQDLPDSLKTERLVLVAILTEIRALMERFAELHGKYYQLRPDNDPAAERDGLETELVEEFASLTLSYKAGQKERKHPRGTNRLIAMGRDIKNIAKNPRRLQWVAVDEEAFKKLLLRLTELNDYLYELMHGHQARILEETTRNTYLELVQVRGSVEDLRNLVAAALLLDRSPGESPGGDARGRNNNILASLAKFKSLNKANDIPENERPPEYDKIISSTTLRYSSIHYEERGESASSDYRIRTHGKCHLGDHTQRIVWIEWKPYKTWYNKKLKKEFPLDENVRRVKELVALLQRDKPKEFCTPHCLGYFNDRDDSDDSDHEERFGLVFEMPENSELLSLYRLIRQISIPSLTDRIALAHKVATSVLYLHAVNWLHKALRSDSIVFFTKNGTPDLEQLHISGFEYARPDREDAATKGTPTPTDEEFNSLWELYRHPDYQGTEAKGVYRKTFDIYSLGVVLLEIGYWKTIDQILGIKDAAAETTQSLKAIRPKLLQQSHYLDHIKANVGNKYHVAVRNCIEGCAAFGIDEKEDQMSVETGAKLQQGFTRDVVGYVESISL
jgi:hypothetical protein